MTDAAYEDQRKRALIRRSADLGLRRVPGRPVWGVVMEMGAYDGVTTLVATDDGAVSLLTSAGDSFHLIKSEWPYSAGTRLIGSAGDFVFECSPAWAYPLPENGMIRFYLLTFDGVMTVEAPLGDVAQGRHPLSDLFYAGDDVHFLVKLVREDPDWRSLKEEIGRPVALVELPPESPPESPAGSPTEPPPEAPAQIAPMASSEAASDGRTDEKPPADGAPLAGTPPADTSGSDLLLKAVAKNDVDQVAILLAQGHDFGPNPRGITPLMAAAHAGALEPLRLLLASGVPVDVKESHGYTALMIACNAGHDVCVRLLLGAGADVNAHDTEGFTSVMFAARKGREDIVRILIERGADTTLASNNGLSAFDLATQGGHAQTASLLLGE